MGRILWCWIIALVVGLLFFMVQPPDAHSRRSSQPLNEAYPEWVTCNTAADCTDAKSAQLFPNRGCNNPEPVNKAHKKEAVDWLTADRVSNMQCQYPVRFVRIKHCGFQCINNPSFGVKQCNYVPDCKGRTKRKNKNKHNRDDD